MLEMGRKDGDKIQLVLKKCPKTDLVHTVMHVCLSYKTGSFLTPWETVTF